MLDKKFIEQVKQTNKEERNNIFSSKDFKKYFTELEIRLTDSLEKYAKENESFYCILVYNKYKDKLELEITMWENYGNSYDDEKNPCAQQSNTYLNNKYYGDIYCLNIKQEKIINDFIKQYLFI